MIDVVQFAGLCPAPLARCPLSARPGHARPGRPRRRKTRNIKLLPAVHPATTGGRAVRDQPHPADLSERRACRAQATRSQSALIGFCGLKVSGFDTTDGYSMKLLFTSLSMPGLGVLAYWRIVERTTHDLERAFLVTSCAAFVLMLPWSAPLWKPIPELSFIQFPWRLCAILTVATAGLLASAIAECLRSGVSPDRKPSLILIVSFAFAVIAAGSVVWRDDRPWRAFSAAAIDLRQQVDMPYVT